MSENPVMSRSHATRVTAIHSPAGVAYWTLAWLWLGFIAYGSLLPYQFQPFDWPSTWIGWWHALLAWSMAVQFTWPANDAWHGLVTWGGLTNLIVNLLLYLPAGIFLRLGAWQRNKPAWEQIFHAISWIASVSYMLECTQAYIPLRIASSGDVLLNTLGGSLGAIFALQLRATVMHAAFLTYTHQAWWIHAWRRWPKRSLMGRFTVAAVLSTNLLLIALWVLWAAQHHPHPPASAAESQSDMLKLPHPWLPFLHEWALPYDQAALHLGTSLTLYILIAAWLAFQVLCLPRRWVMWWVVLGIGLITALHQAVLIAQGNSMVDLTHSAIAIMAAALVITSIALTARAVRKQCRRRVQIPITQERRRWRHHYSHPTLSH